MDCIFVQLIRKCMALFDILSFIISAFNWKFAFFLIPVFLIMMLDTLGWKLLIGRHRFAPAFLTLLQLHMGTESLLSSIPGGFALTDPAKIFYLQRYNALHPMDSLGSLVARRWMIGISQLLFILVGIFFAFTTMNSQPLKIPGLGDNMIFIVIGAILFIFILALIARSFSKGKIGTSFIVFLERIPLHSVKRWAYKHRTVFQNADEYFRLLGNNHKSYYLLLVGIYFLTWLMNAAETYALAAYFNMSVSISQAVCIEALLSIVTLSAFFLPSGAVVKDLGYIGIFSGLAVSTDMHTVMSFILFKRLITLSWIAIGYVLLAKISAYSFFRRPTTRKEISSEASVDPSPGIL